ncbi:MAG: multidrug DMT transporter permease, partial [Burkholderiales bacterium RIFOXYC12_FULL_60_6]
MTALKRETLGMWLGVLGVAIFAVTLPMTRLATGTAEAPQLSPWFVTFGRAALAGALSLVFLAVTRSTLPTATQHKSLDMALMGNAIGYPLLLGFALRQVTSGHAAVITALLPLATAAIAAWVLHQRARLGFWICAVLGSALVVSFSLLRTHQQGHGFGFEWADLLLLGAVLAASTGYVYGAQVTHALGAERVICWICVMALPLTVPGALLTWPAHSV